MSRRKDVWYVDNHRENSKLANTQKQWNISNMQNPWIRDLIIRGKNFKAFSGNTRQVLPNFGLDVYFLFF
jgi:hypothetical protein